ncbi:hypothetical protein [Clostridium luticellarii]|uniref:Uncharacterized protein n=1 Tax=Clostridium luticellarii TaxID=1691940 RepID=A0A2T0BNP7_9CLOT|nr:hypothetical protein [Clostridium luticellarii]PRR85518.1 hypothetical protein CLLU_14390 [Clostridium luticellarii]
MKFECKSKKGNVLKIDTEISIDEYNYGKELRVNKANLDGNEIQKDGQVVAMKVEKVIANGKPVVAVRADFNACKQILKILKSRRKIDHCYFKGCKELEDYYNNIFPKEAEKIIEKLKREKETKLEAEFAKIQDIDIIEIKDHSYYGISVCNEASHCKFFTEFAKVLKACKYTLPQEYQTDVDWGDYSDEVTYKIPFGKLKEIFEDAKSKLVEIQAKKKAEQDTRDAKEKAIFQKAKETGEPQELSRILAECNDPDEDCSLDIVYTMAMPDGTTQQKRQHTW